MKKIIAFSLVLMMSFFNLAAQKVALPGIQIGQDVPEVVMDKIVQVDGTVTSAKVSDYKDKLLILDFMYTTCSSCVWGLPKKNSLQQQFGDKIKVMVVIGGENYAPGMLERENSEFIKKYLTSPNFLNFHKVKIPWVVENKRLNELFPHVSVCHMAWIYKGKLVALTEQDYVTAENIQLVLDGKKNDWPVKNDFIPMDIETPLVKQPASNFDGVIARNNTTTLFGKYHNDLESKMGTVRDSVNRMRRDYFINIPILDLYKMFWMKAGKLPDPNFVGLVTNTVLEVKDMKEYVRQPHSNEYSYVERKRTWKCLEVNSPDTGQSEKEHALFMIKQLDELLGLHGRYEKRNMKCLVLYRTNKEEKFKSKFETKPLFNASTYRTPNVSFIGNNLEGFAWTFNLYHGNPPVFNDTNYEGLVDMELTINAWTDIPSVRKALQPYGLDFREEEREMEVFVLTEKKG